MVSTTVAAGSNGQTISSLTGGNLSVASTTGFATTGTIYVKTTAAYPQAVVYTGVSGGNIFTGCTSSGTGTVATSNSVTQSNDEGIINVFTTGGNKSIPASVSTDSTVGSYFTSHGHGALTNAIDISHARDLSPVQRNGAWPLVDSLGVYVGLPHISITTTYYKMRGYYATGSVFETWVVTGAPSSSPPSGHTLTGVVVAATWTIVS